MTSDRAGKPSQDPPPQAEYRTVRRLAMWRSVDELSGTDEFQRFVHAEFPEQARAGVDPMSRRDLLRLMGASIALAGFPACTRPPAEKIVPYVHQPEEFVPGQPLFFATAMSLNGFAK